MKIVSRANWRARNAINRTGLNPSYGTTIHYEGPHMGTFSHSSCATKVRGIQAYHMNKGWSDIAYTAIVCPHGYIYVCRWTGVRTAANGTNVGNASAYAVCALIGQNDAAPAVMTEAIADLCVFLRQSGAGSRVNGHRDWKSTACPGDILYGKVRSGTFLKSAPHQTNPIPTPPQERNGAFMALSDADQLRLFRNADDARTLAGRAYGYAKAGALAGLNPNDPADAEKIEQIKAAATEFDPTNK